MYFGRKINLRCSYFRVALTDYPLLCRTVGAIGFYPPVILFTALQMMLAADSMPILAVLITRS